MDRQEEYHDPDYPEASSSANEEVSNVIDDEKIEKIKSVVRREFTSDLQSRENDVMLIDQRSLLARRLLQRLRYVLVHNYYNNETLKLTSAQIQDEVAAQNEPRARSGVASQLRDGQRRLHPSVRKLLGAQASGAELHEILFRRRGPRNNTRKDYSAMLQSRNYTIAADTTKSLRPGSPEPQEATTSRPKKVPRRMMPKITNVVTLDEAIRNQTKHRYRIIIGNTSKFAPPASSADRSTHKWLLYVRGLPEQPSLSHVVRAVTVRLHHSYAPHHSVHIDKPPFHISRRGWGEFPAKIELHFALPERNSPATVEHTIKLDRNYTGLQTLGAETVVDVWLYSSEEMLKYAYIEDTKDIKQELSDPPQDTQEIPIEPPEISIENSIFETVHDKQTDNWLDFFSNATELDVDEMIIKPQKKIEEKNEVESLIETSVISKDNSDENHLRTTIKQEIETELNEEIVEEEYVNEIVDLKKDATYLPNNLIIKQELIEDLPNEILNQTSSFKKRIMKYLDPTTGKIYYLEMDRKLDLTKVQEIVINSKGNVKTAKISPIKPNGLKKVRKNKKGGVSLLKPEIKSLLKNDKVHIQNQKAILRRNYAHIENDHCYLGTVKEPQNFFTENYEEEITVKEELSVYKCICAALIRFCSVKMSVDYCLKKMPIITSEVNDTDFQKCFPYTVETEEKYWKLDFAKRRNIEWSRAKLINKLLMEHLNTTEAIWRTKQILIYSRLHGYYPIRTETISRPSVTETDWSSWTDFENSRRIESNIKETYPNVSDITTLTKFNLDEFNQNLSESLDLTESDDEIEIVGYNEPVRIKKESVCDISDLPVLPVVDPQERLRFLYIERKCADIGIELRNEDIGNGYSYSAVHAVLLSAMKSFASTLIRSALAETLSEERDSHALPPVWVGSPPPAGARLRLRAAARGAARGAGGALCARHLAARPHHASFL